MTKSLIPVERLRPPLLLPRRPLGRPAAAAAAATPLPQIDAHAPGGLRRQQRGQRQRQQLRHRGRPGVRGAADAAPAAAGTAAAQQQLRRQRQHRSFGGTGNRNKPGISIFLCGSRQTFK